MVRGLETLVGFRLATCFNLPLMEEVLVRYVILPIDLRRKPKAPPVRLVAIICKAIFKRLDVFLRVARPAGATAGAHSNVGKGTN